ncbi:DNA primase small subunit [Halogranum gelatinilyticum]|uniref:DNA primase small subunit PriS n=1 Tax=Halogranum gelatinilyticum TaxID=660521 RepID=A0A1G9SWH1_9EURY|nr:DNA primase small subunit PriS [Halogranum gelatinilyticum]SDM39786.1 DNA primase small subunit [Halogranum gelatinilyticum]
MDARTRDYLKGRFGDYYRQATVTPPPNADAREWGYIPWTAGSGTTMVRHESLLNLGHIGDFLAREAPRHAYFSAARYTDPSAKSMSAKDWRSADLVFDLDADHLPAIDPEQTSYKGMLTACKGALLRLLDILEDDFGFEELEVVFSGGRGYHVHVRDEGVRELDSEARREIVDYIRAIDLDFDGLVQTRAVGGTTRRMLRTEGGWGKRTHDRLLAFVDELDAMDEDDALDRLQELDGIGEGRATTILGAFERNSEAVQTGNVEAGGPGLRMLVEALAQEVVEEQTAPIDEPVTTDLRRLIRLPGSLHGGTGLEVQRIERDAVDDFQPLEDAVPERFTRRLITVEADKPATVEMFGERTNIEPGENSVRECVGVLLMARGDAEKAKE